MYQPIYRIRCASEDRSEYRRCLRWNYEYERNYPIDGLSEAETRKWRAVADAEQAKLTTIEAAEAVIAELLEKGIGADLGEDWIIESVEREIGTLKEKGVDVKIQEKVRQKQHTFFWSIEECEGPSEEEIPKYLFDALNRFEDERQKAEAEG